MRNNILGLLLVGIIAASCGEAKKETTGSLNDKKVELEKLKKQQADLNGKIQALEAEIAKLDPKSATSTAKLVSVTTLGATDFSHYIDLQGRIDANNISYVSPPGQPGVVKALYVKQGQSVRKGQLLAKLDDQLIRQEVEPLRVQLASAEDTYKRTKNLWDQGIGSYQNVLNAKTHVESLQKQIGMIQRRAALTNVTAPNSGVIEQLNLRVGETFMGYVGSIPQIMIVNTGDLSVKVSVPENYLSRVSMGSKIKVVLPEQNNRELDAVVTVVQKLINQNTRAFDVEAKIPSHPDLKPNQIAQVKILDYAAQNAVVIPLNVVQNDDKVKYVFVMEKDGDRMTARKKTVQIGEAYGDNVEIKSGLKPGDQLITEGYQSLYEGQVITVAAK